MSSPTVDYTAQLSQLCEERNLEYSSFTRASNDNKTFFKSSITFADKSICAIHCSGDSWNQARERACRIACNYLINNFDKRKQ